MTTEIRSMDFEARPTEDNPEELESIVISYQVIDENGFVKAGRIEISENLDEEFAGPITTIWADVITLIKTEENIS